MTSHTLAAFRTDEARSHSHDEADCTFCAIAHNYPHHPSLLEPLPSPASSPSSSASQPSPSAYITYSDPSSFAILDILPLRRGHTLVIPRKHIRQLSDLPLNQAAEFAKALVRATRMVGRALGDDRLQVITNQVYAQVVPHLHFHIVPAPPLPGGTAPQSSASQQQKEGSATGSEPTRSFSTALSSSSISLLKAFGHGRDELEDEDAVQLTRRMREALQLVLKEEQEAEEKGVRQQKGAGLKHKL
ncbi:hypothetical protein OC844_006096 [Tilletia horrida]|nr:hypothetical protein OC844_006096 [Tilletia horrida]